MIGEVRLIYVPFYNMVSKAIDMKSRPALIIARADNEDYVVLPVSTISIQANRDPHFDFEIDPYLYPLLNLTKRSYVRTHKQTVVHLAEISRKIGNMKEDYPDLYLHVIELREEFSRNITDQALQ